MVEGSLAEQPDAKPYARHAARRALNSYLSARGISAHAEACPQNAESHRVVYQLPNPLPKVTVISSAQTDEFERAQYPGLEIIRMPPGAAAMNSGAARAHGDVLVFARRPIAAMESGWLQEIVSQVVRPEVGAVGARVWSSEGNLEDGGLILGLGGVAAPPFRGLPRGHPGYFNRAWLQQDYSAVSAACLAVRRSVFAEAGGFDAGNLPHRFYDVDLCLRLGEKKMRMIWTPYANLTLSDCSAAEKADAAREARRHAKAMERAAAPRSLLQSQSLARSARIYPGHSAANLTRPWRLNGPFTLDPRHKPSIVMDVRLQVEFDDLDLQAHGFLKSRSADHLLNLHT